MTMHFFRYRLLFNLRPQQCFAPSYLKKDERPHDASARKTKQSEN